MSYVFLLMAMAFSAAITVGGRLYNIRNRGAANVSRLYNMLVPVFASLGWLVFWLFDFSFDAAVLPYSLLYGIGYSCFTIGMLGALGTGSTSLTALVKQLAQLFFAVFHLLRGSFVKAVVRSPKGAQFMRGQQSQMPYRGLGSGVGVVLNIL